MTSLYLKSGLTDQSAPEEGVSIGAKIMQEHLNLFIELTDDYRLNGNYG